MLQVRKVFDTEKNETVGVIDFVDHMGELHTFKSLIIIENGNGMGVDTWHEENVDACIIQTHFN